jgi:hypothetical protein
VADQFGCLGGWSGRGVALGTWGPALTQAILGPLTPPPQGVLEGILSKDPEQQVPGHLVNELINRRNTVFHATDPRGLEGILETGMIRPGPQYAWAVEGRRVSSRAHGANCGAAVSRIFRFEEAEPGQLARWPTLTSRPLWA